MESQKSIRHKPENSILFHICKVAQLSDDRIYLLIKDIHDRYFTFMFSKSIFKPDLYWECFPREPKVFPSYEEQKENKNGF